MNAMKSKKESPRSLVRVGVTSLGLAVLLSGCGQSLSLSELPPTPLNVRLPGCRDCVGLELTFDTDPSDCPSLDRSTRATVNGHALVLSEPGGMGSGLGPFLPSCRRPQFTSPLRSHELGLDQESSRIEFTGGGKTLIMEGLSLDVERSVRWTAPGEPVLQAGQQVSLELTVPTDEVDFDFSAVTFTPDNAQANNSFTLGGAQLTSEGSTLRFTPPASLKSGRGTLSVNLTVHPKVTRCEGLASCSVRSTASLALPITALGQ